MHRWRPVCLVLTLLAALPAARSHAQHGAARQAPNAVAILIRNPDSSGGAPPYALADQFGKVQRLVEPTPGLPLSRFVGQRVRIRHDSGRTLLATQLELPTLPATSGTDPLRQVSPAQFVPPRRPTRASRASGPGDRRNSVVLAQAAEDLGRYGESVAPGPAASDERSVLDAATDAADDLPGGFDEPEDPTTPIDLDQVLEDEEADSLPAPVTGEGLEPIPADDYVPEIAPISPSGLGHDPDCPHCQKQIQLQAIDSQYNLGDCPHCQASSTAGGRCATCGRSGGLCGPSCSPASKRGVYARAEYLLWWFDGMTSPPLVTTNDATTQPILGQAGTNVAYAGELLDDGRSGVRLLVGGWLDHERDFGLEADWAFFETESDVFSTINQLGVGSSLGRPYYNIDTPGEDARLIAFNGTIGGTLAITSRSELQSLGLRVRTGICCRDIGGCQTPGCQTCNGGRGLLQSTKQATAISRVDFVMGYRYTELEEQMLFQDSRTVIATSSTSSVRELFETDNDFHGLDLGFLYEWRSRRWGAELAGRVAVGGTRQRVSIFGTTTTDGVTTSGGLYAQASNLGVYQRDRFSMLPELSARMTYRLSERVTLSGAYTVLYWANVARPGDQITPVVATAAAPPRFDWEEASLWAHGLNFSLDYNY